MIERIFETKNQKLKSSTIIILKILIFIYPILFIWQGGDLTDAGFHALNYQNFFSNLEIGRTNSIIFLTDIIGAIWLQLFPGLGLIGLKLLCLLFLYSILMISYLILKPIAKNNLVLLLGLFCGMAFSLRYVEFIFNYDIASLFFLLLTAYFLIKGIKYNKGISLFFSGILFGVATLSRFSDIVFITMLPFALLYIYKYPGEKNTLLGLIVKTFKTFLLFVLGFISLLLLFFGILMFLELEMIFIDNLAAIGDKSSHSLSRLITSYLREIKIFIMHALPVISLILTTSLIYNYSKTIKNWSPYIFFSIILFVVAFFIYKGFSYGSDLKFLIPSFCLLPISLAIIKKSKFHDLTIILLLIALAQVAGTNTGLFLKLGYGFIILLPLAILVLAEKKEHIFRNIKISTIPVLMVGIPLILFLSLYARFGWIYHVSSGLDSRLKAVYPIEHKWMKGIYTTAERASYIEAVTNAVEKNIKDDNSLFIYGHQPMLYYLTSNAPPIEKYWLTNNSVTVEELFLSIKKSIYLTGKWPMILDTQQNVLGERGQKMLYEFLQKNNYVKISDGPKFIIWNRPDRT